MSLAQITEKIEQDARAEAEKILAEASAQREKIKEEAVSEARELQSAAEERFARERPEIFRRRDIVAKLDVDKLFLASRRKLIQDVYDQVLEKLKALGKEEYLAFCGRLLREASEGGDEVAEISADEKYLTSEWFDDFNARNGTKVTLSDKRQNIAGGFLLNRGRVCINCSWDMLVQAAKEKLETEVVKRLFPE